MRSTEIIHEIVKEFGRGDKRKLMEKLQELRTQVRIEQKREVNRIVKQFSSI